MRYPIKEHKGQQIYYDDYNDKFVCDIELNDNLRNAKRNSIADIEKDIDSFIKANYKFVPFTAFHIGYAIDLVRIVSIRTDGILVSDNRTQYKPSDFDKFYIADEETIKELKINDDTLDQAIKKHKERKEELLSNLKPKDMTSYLLNP